ncbi:MAG: OmpA family protein [Bacteroidaceae bacterium]|nr:OmpA family protein [Bacteroidaceae bacterium]
MKNNLKSKSKIAVMFFAAMLIASFSGYAQKSKSVVFKDADRAMKNAKSIKADILSPLEYDKALGYYEDADKDFDNNKGIEKIEENLFKATNSFNRSIDLSYSSRIELANSLNARNDALSVGADIYAKDLWADAEKKFISASVQLEKGNKDDSYKVAVEAIAIYRKAELTAIKTNMLDETRTLLAKADDMKVYKKAPETIKKAKKLLADTERELETNRYDMDYPRSLAKQAKYEAKHAIYLNETIKKIDDENVSMEELILRSEIPFIKIAETIGFVAQFDEGTKLAENEIIDYILFVQQQNETLFAENTAQNNRINDLVEHVNVLNKERVAMNAEFENEIGKRTAEMKSNMQAFETTKSKLAAKIKHQERINEKFSVVEKVFTSAEAKVFRSGDDVIIRMEGFGFESGKSEIQPKNFELLTKVQEAIKTFPNSSVIIEGYTDAFGSDSLNLVLSQKRSDSVTDYLKANMTELKSMDITSIGFGENNPIANNETEEGRRKNRRIDIIIKPKF